MQLTFTPGRDGLPEQVSLQPESLDGRTWSVLCRWCHPSGGEHLRVQRCSGVSEEEAKAAAESAARAHASDHQHAIKQALRSVDYDEQARRLGWTRAQATAMRAAGRGDLHYDQDGYFILDLTRAVGGQRGRTVAASRVAGLVHAGLLAETARDRFGHFDLRLTADGETALDAWLTVRPAPQPPRSEPDPDQVPPLHNGHEAARRARATRERSVPYAREADAGTAEARRIVERAEADHARETAARRRKHEDIEEAARAAEERAASPGAPSAEIGNVITSTKPAPATTPTTPPAASAPQPDRRPARTVRPASTPRSGTREAQSRTSPPTKPGDVGARAREVLYWRTRMRHLAPWPAGYQWHIKSGHPGGDYADTGHDPNPPDHHTPTLLTRDDETGGASSYRGACLHCTWEGPERRDRREHLALNLAVEDAHDHSHPGWRQLPVLDDHPDPRTWRQLSRHYPPAWIDTGAPVLIRPRGLHREHLPPQRKRPRYLLRIRPSPATPQDAPAAAQTALF